MDQTRIERVDSVPMLIAWMERMQVAATIDRHWKPHREWEGLSYGRLTVLFIAFVLQQREHRLSYFEDWLAEHQYVIQACTGWRVRPQDGTDDRLGILLQTLGGTPATLDAFYQEHGQHLVQAYALSTDIVRYDTTAFNVYHAAPEPHQAHHALLRFG